MQSQLTTIDSEQPNRVLKHRRSGQTGLVVLIEIILIAIACWGVISFAPLLSELGGSKNSAARGNSDTEPLIQLTLTSTGQELWVQRGRNEIFSINVETQALRPVFSSQSDSIGEWSASRDGSTWLLRKYGCVLSIYRNQELIVSDHTDDDKNLSAFISADGNTAACVSGRSDIRCWDLSEQPPIVSEFMLIKPCYKGALDPVGRLIVATDDGELQTYNCKTGELISTISGIRHLSQAPHFSSDGQWMALATVDALERYDLQTGTRQWAIHAAEGDAVHSVAISQDGKRIAVSWVRATITILDSHTGATVSLHLPESIMHKIAFSATSDELFSTAADGSLRKWSLSSTPLATKQLALSY